MARLLALTALVLAASSAVGPGPDSAAASGSSHGLLSATPAADDLGCAVTGSAPVDAAPAPRAWMELALLGAGDCDTSSPAGVAVRALAPLALAPKTSPPLAARR